MKKYLLIFQQAPYKNSLSLESFELSLALAAFEQDVTLLFKADGVLQLLANQNTNINHLAPLKAFTKGYGALDSYDINNVYIDQEAHELVQNLNTNLVINTKIINYREISKLMQNHDIILNF